MDVTWDNPKINSPGTPSEEGLNQVYHSNSLKCANDAMFMISHILDEDFEVNFMDLFWNKKMMYDKCIEKNVKICYI